MPRKAPLPAAVAPVTALLPPPPPSPLIQLLRKDWRWAAISQFLWMFSDAFGLLDWDIEHLEDDLDNTETRLLPDIIAKLLYALTYNRQINRVNAMDHLRRQYVKRAPKSNVLGTPEKPVEWATLGLTSKVRILHELCEWQMEDPARFRALLTSEEDAVSWRIDPVGWDKAGNTYFLFDDNRLWVQRLPPPPPAPPRPPKKSSLKAKRALKRSRPSEPSSSTPFESIQPPAKKSHRKRELSPELTPPPSEDEEIILSGPRKRTQVEFYGNVTPTVNAISRSGNLRSRRESVVNGTSHSKATRSSTRTSGGALNSAGNSRRSETTHQTPSKPSLGRNSLSTVTPSLPLGTRVSRRLRNVEDEWQQVPEEWLVGESNDSKPSTVVNGKQNMGKGKGKARDSDGDDDESDLSELTDEEEHEQRVVLRLRGGGSGGERMDVDQAEEDDLTPPPEDGPVGSERESSTQTVAAVPESGKSVPVKEVPVPSETTAGDQKVAPAEEHVAIKSLSRPAEETTVSVPNGLEVKEVKPTEDALDTEKVEDVEEEVDENDEVKMAVKEAENLPAGFVEWEAVCVTLFDWRTFPEQFSKSSHPDEKALYRLLVNEVGPKVIEVLVAKEQERLKQEAINNRKRSSRIAIKELEKEEQLRHQKAQQEMEDRMEKMRREEARKAREEAETEAREKAREERLRDRETRLAAREEAIMRKIEEEIKAKEKAERDRERRAKRRLEGDMGGSDSEGDTSGVGEGKDGKADKEGGKSNIVVGVDAKESWELNCEVCRMTGWNLDDDADVVVCDDCGRWQHTACHDKKDLSEGRPKRNWEKVDFKCKECRRRAARERHQAGASASPQKHVNGTGTNITTVNGAANDQNRGRPSLDAAAPRSVAKAPTHHSHHAANGVPGVHRHPAQGGPSSGQYYQQHPSQMSHPQGHGPQGPAHAGPVPQFYPQHSQGSQSTAPQYQQQQQRYSQQQQYPPQAFYSPQHYPPHHSNGQSQHPQRPPHYQLSPQARPSRPDTYPPQHRSNPHQPSYPVHPHQGPNISPSIIPHTSSHPFGPSPPTARQYPHPPPQGYPPQNLPRVPIQPSPSSQHHSGQPYPSSQSRPSGSVPAPSHQNGHGQSQPQTRSPHQAHPHPNHIHLPSIHSLPLNGPHRPAGAISTPPIQLPPLQPGYPDGKGNGLV